MNNLNHLKFETYQKKLKKTIASYTKNKNIIDNITLSYNYVSNIYLLDIESKVYITLDYTAKQVDIITNIIIKCCEIFPPDTIVSCSNYNFNGLSEANLSLIKANHQFNNFKIYCNY